MTKSEIEKLIEYLRADLPKFVTDIEVGDNTYKSQICCSVATLYDVLREYPSDEEKTCGPDYKAMYATNAAELNKAQREIESIMIDMNNLSVEHARYVGAVAAMETIFGRKFEPQR